MNKKQVDWWKSAVIYQIYPKSFQDSNGDGYGDICGIISRLDYLKKLGIDAIWLCPVFKSPQDDNGYDISDYQDIDPIFGSLDEMELLIAEAKKREIVIMLDLVLNHTSDEHMWFKEAKKSKTNRYHDYYVWRDGTESNTPNEMQSGFSGSAWEWVPELKQYYFHQFSKKQPDLNWENPEVRTEIYKMIRWWEQKGIGGFRMDVIDQIAKEPDREITVNGPKLHTFLRELSREVFQGRNLITVGETWGATTELAKLYSNPDGSEFSMVFQFEHIGLDQEPGKAKWDLSPLKLRDLKQVIGKWQKELYQKGWNSLFWNNHDLPRIVSRWGNDEKYRNESAKMLATLLYGLQGTPYIYQGEELGMTNVKYGLEEYRDIESLNMYQERIREGYTHEQIMKSIYEKGRDNARTPMQWNEGRNAGFTSGTPWIKVNPNYTVINAEEQQINTDSVFRYYQRLIKLRKTYNVFTDGYYQEIFPENQEIFAYTRTTDQEKLFVICNFYGNTAAFAFPEEDCGEKELLIYNYPTMRVEDKLRPYEARMYLYNKSDK